MKNIKSVSTFILATLLLIQCQAKSKPATESGNFEELKELIKSSNHGKANISFVAAAAISTPCVVHIRTKINVVVNTVSPFQDFFGNEFFFQQPRNQNQESSGSGVIIDPNGYIVTNNHVIQNATEIEVTLRNKITYKARIIGTDKDSDIALIKIEETKLPTLEFANSDSTMVGEWVLAVGNPFNLESTVTQGIVSAKGRALNMQNQSNTSIESFIQTDAAVNPGNSGGALVNLQGELIGINTAIASPTGAYAGYAFAVPSNLVYKVVEDLKRHGTVQRAYLGIQADQLTSEKAKKLKLPSASGVLIAMTNKGGAAEKAGLKAGDLILKINGNNISSFPELLEQINTHRPGDIVAVEYIRNGNSEKVNVELKNKQNNNEIIKLDDNILRKIGVEVTELSSLEKSNLRINHGLKVVKLDQNGILERSTDIRVGFIILAVNEQPVTNLNDFQKAIFSQQNNKTIILEGIYPNRPYTYQYAFKL
jgi:serine protease Do